MRLRGKVDRNHADIVGALRQVGCSVQSLADIGNGCPDLLVGFRGKNFLLEIKDELLSPSKKKLTEDEQQWHALWSGNVQVVESIYEAMLAIAGVGECAGGGAPR